MNLACLCAGFGEVKHWADDTIASALPYLEGMFVYNSDFNFLIVSFALLMRVLTETCRFTRFFKCVLWSCTKLCNGVNTPSADAGAFSDFNCSVRAASLSFQCSMCSAMFTFFPFSLLLYALGRVEHQNTGFFKAHTHLWVNDDTSNWRKLSFLLRAVFSSSASITIASESVATTYNNSSHSLKGWRRHMRVCVCVCVCVCDGGGESKPLVSWSAENWRIIFQQLSTLETFSKFIWFS